MSIRPPLLFIPFLLVLAACEPEIPEEVVAASEQLPEEIDYNLHIKPLLSDNCFACHGPDKGNIKAGLQLMSRATATAELPNSPGKFPIVPGKLAKSEVFHRIIADDPEQVMPPPESNLKLSAREKALLIRWMEEGAEYQPHWAFIPPQAPKVPETETLAAAEGAQPPQNPIDRFVRAKLQAKGLTPSPEADGALLLRRLSLDLTGLPPTPEETQAFLADQSEDAYEKQVDRLLASEHYGEQMALGWLDAARYADTHGYTVDRYRPAWPWRDWVIQSFNQNQPFDAFVTWQLAGDLMPNPSRKQLLATGFNRNHAQNMEGGIVNEEFRVEYVADRTNTLGKALLGLTVECARCHDHKYDPISQKEYFQLFAFFNNIDEAGQISWDNALPVPTILLTDEKQDSLLAFIDGHIGKAEKEVAAAAASEKQHFHQWLQHNREVSPNLAIKGLQAHFPLDRLQEGKFPNRLTGKPIGSIPDPVFREGKSGQALQLNGDEELVLGDVGIFDRAEPFSVGLWVNIPEQTKEGVIFHKGNGAILYGFRGYHLHLRENKLELQMAHLWPHNMLLKVSEREVPKNEWAHLMATYDGSSKAEGFKLYLNGERMPMATHRDNLYKSILFPSMKKQPGLQIGARWRGTGLTNGLVDEIMVFERELTAPEVALVAQAQQGPFRLASRSPSNEQFLFPYYLTHFSADYQQAQQSLLEWRKKRASLTEAVPQAMVMAEQDTLRTTYLLERGAYDAHGEVVVPGSINSVLPFPDSLPKNRSGLAKWLFLPENPLPARVMVNRFWQHYFGRGLVKTVADFGNQGEMPSHPQLLDWLAVRFQESGWDVKAIQKLIVMSATYRQASFTSEKLREQDPDNIWLARGPSARLSAEQLRDHVLASGGLLVRKIGGPSVKPYQPEGLWAINGGKYEQDVGENLYRRSMYTFWKRTVPPPTMNVFDAPDRSYCVVDRQHTNTPLQALALLNDPQFNEAAKALAAKALRQENGTDAQIGYAFQSLTGREPMPQEMEVLQRLWQQELEKFSANPQKLSGWLKVGENQVDGQLDEAQVGAMTLVASAIINSDAFMVKR